MRLSIRTGRKPSLTIKRAVTAPFTPKPPVISTFIAEPIAIHWKGKFLLAGFPRICPVHPIAARFYNRWVPRHPTPENETLNYFQCVDTPLDALVEEKKHEGIKKCLNQTTLGGH